MRAHAEVFISATTRELRSYRGETKNALLTLKIFPIEQNNFELAHGPLTKVLHDLIDRCDAVIHLAGFYYGAEPPQRPPGEAQEAEQLMRRVVLFLLKSTYSTGHLDPHLRTGFLNHLGLLMDLSLDQGEIRQRIAELGQEVGFDPEDYRKVVERILEEE